MRRLGGVLVIAFVAVVMLTSCSKFLENGRVGRPPTSSSATVVETTKTVSGTEPTASKPASSTKASAETTLNTNGKSDIPGMLKGSASLSTFTRLLKASGLMVALKGKGPHTLFAPNDDAFSALGTRTVEALEEPANIEKLRTVIRYHMLTGAVPTVQLVTIRSALTYQGGRLKISQDGGETVLNGTIVVLSPDIKTRNGLVHVINGVMIPPGIKLQ